MVTVPGFLLRRLYVKGSLKNTSEGFQFLLKNTLGSGYARKMQPLTVDGEVLPMGESTLQVDGKVVSFPEVSEEQPFTLGLNKTITVQVRTTRLTAGPHKLGMGFDVPGLGTLNFDFTDVVQED
ncbi:MAG: hypothetical protein EXR47_02615 [Dehalococcoidia bacterium]|nr:hypothetical protein [Dehalococcoidia bacterium]